MHGRAAGFVVGGKMNCPRRGTRASVTAAVHKTAEAPKHVAERDAGREDVGDLPQREFFDPDVKAARERGSDESAVVNQPALLNHENFPERFVGKLALPERDDLKRPRASQRPDDEPRTKVKDFFAGNARARRTTRSGPQPGQKAERDQHAIPVNRKRAEVECNGMHKGKIRTNGTKEN